jgi:hypothetical protein
MDIDGYPDLLVSLEFVKKGTESYEQPHTYKKSFLLLNSFCKEEKGEDLECRCNPKACQFYKPGNDATYKINP